MKVNTALSMHGPIAHRINPTATTILIIIQIKQIVSAADIPSPSRLSPRWRRSSSRTDTTKRLIYRQNRPCGARLCSPLQTGRLSYNRSADRGYARSFSVPFYEICESCVAELSFSQFDYLGYRVALFLFSEIIEKLLRALTACTGDYPIADNGLIERKNAVEL